MIWSLGPKQAKGLVRRPSLALSFDDGPGRCLTPRVAELLDSRGVRATFFLLGRRAEKHPELVEMLAAGGHELACHTHDHLNAWKNWPWRVAADIDRGYDALARWVPGNGLFRPPYGKSTPFTRWQLRRRGAPVVRWTHDSHDTTHGALPAPEQVIEQVMMDLGGIVLLHDFDREGEAAYVAARAEYVLQVTDGLVTAAQRAGFLITTVGAMIGAGESAL